jgi:ribosomal-protein-alanine acetyltransferase
VGRAGVTRRRGGAIRPAEPADIGALLAIEAVFPTDRLERRGFRHAIRSPSIDLLVADRDGAALGYAAVHRRAGSTLAHLASIAVRPDVSGQGLGRRLLEGAEAATLAQGCTRLRLEVRADNAAAQRLYERAGFRRVETVDDYYEDGAAAWRYEKALAFAAITSTSTLNSGRAKPETIISVEAGGGAATKRSRTTM